MKNYFDKEIIPPNDKERLAALHRYNLLKVLPAGYFTNLAHIIAKTFEVPIALVSLVDKEEVFFPGNFGMEDTTKISRGLSLCSLAILNESPTVFDNALKEPCLLANPLVTGKFGLRFYAGAPIITPDGFAIGTVCIVDKAPREFGEKDQVLLKYFAYIAMQEIQHRYDNLSVAMVERNSHLIG